VSDDSGYTGSDNYPASVFQGYQIYRQNASEGWDKLNLLPLTDPMFHDLAAVDPNKTYTYQVASLDTAWQESDGSVAASGNPGDYDAPAAPAGLRALSGPGAGEITLVWNRSAETDLASYRVYQKQSNGSYTYLGAVDPNEHEYVDPNLPSSTVYTYAVAAKDISGALSALSATAKAKARAASPAPPASQGGGSGLTWVGAIPMARVGWQALGSNVTYKIYRRLDEEPWWESRPVFVGGGVEEYDDYGADACRAYRYLVTAVDPNTGEESADPNEDIFLERGMRPNTPGTATTSTSITIHWEGLIWCQPTGNGYEVTNWVIRHNVSAPGDPNVWEDEVLDPEETSFTFQVPNAEARYSFAVYAKIRNLYHAVDPNDPQGEPFNSFISEDICLSTTTLYGDGQNGCRDYSGNDPGSGSGGGPPPESQEEPGELLYPRRHRHGRLIPEAQEDNVRIATHMTGKVQGQPGCASAEGGRTEPEVARGAATAPSLQNSFDAAVQLTDLSPALRRGGSHPGPAHVGRARDPLVSGAPSYCRVDEVTAFSLSPHRVIGAASTKQFRFLYFHWDHLGSVRVVTDPNGAKIGGSKFLPFGEGILGTSVASNSHRFTGHERDDEIDRDYLLARYYTSQVVRFLSVDPDGAHPGYAQSWNRYGYVMGRPVSYFDPTGRYAQFFLGTGSQPGGKGVGLSTIQTNLSTANISNKATAGPKWYQPGSMATQASSGAAVAKNGYDGHMSLVGHSRGALEANMAAKTLGEKGVRTGLLVMVDPELNSHVEVSKAVGLAVNISNGDSYATAAAGSGTTVINLHFTATHGKIDDAANIQNFIGDLVKLEEAGTLTADEVAKLASKYGLEIVDPAAMAAEDAEDAEFLQNTFSWVYGQDHGPDPTSQVSLFGSGGPSPVGRGGPTRPQLPR
jgi:RHS repeat-associated protein